MRYNLSNTRPITLLESPRKLLVKILNARLSTILASSQVLQSTQFAGLPGGSTAQPIQVIRNLLDDAALNNREIWLYLQDLSKCYDRVNILILRKALLRIKIPFPYVELILDLFKDRTNQVITQAGVTDPYNVLVGIDQGEVISPLLWCIYYDPLLSRIQQQNSLGYNISHSSSSQVNNNIMDINASADIPLLAFMDDTMWCSDSSEHLASILSIADSFYQFTNIKVNPDKAVLLSTKRNINQVSLTLDNGQVQNIKVVPPKQSIRYLGVWIAASFNKGFIIQQCQTMITQAINLMGGAKITDNQLLYIFNRVLIPRIEYRTQATVLTAQVCSSIIAPYIKMFKRKLSLSSTAPNAMLVNNGMYNFRHLYDVQLQSKLSQLVVAINNTSLVGNVLNIRLCQLQLYYWLDSNPLLVWPFSSPKSLDGSFLTQVLTLAKKHEFSFTVPSKLQFIIQGGSDVVRTHLSEEDYKSMYKFLRRKRILFRSQLVELATASPLSWAAYNKLNGLSFNGRIPEAWKKLMVILFAGLYRSPFFPTLPPISNRNLQPLMLPHKPFS